MPNAVLVHTFIGGTRDGSAELEMQRVRPSDMIEAANAFDWALQMLRKKEDFGPDPWGPIEYQTINPMTCLVGGDKTAMMMAKIWMNTMAEITKIIAVAINGI